MTEKNIKNLEKTFRFRNFPIYKDARVFIRDLKKFCKMNFPKEEQFGLFSQISRALDSILLNIAEGADRTTDKDFALFLNRAHTSLNEVVACLDSAFDSEYITEIEHRYFLERAAVLVYQFTAFRKTLLQHAA